MKLHGTEEKDISGFDNTDDRINLLLALVF